MIDYQGVLRFLVPVVLALVTTSAAEAEIVSRTSTWRTGEQGIQTEVVVRAASGETRQVTVAGGTVDGVGMVRFHLSLSDLAGGALPDDVAGQIIREFVRTRTDAGTPLHWEQSCVFVTPSATGTSDLAGDREHEIIEETLAHWLGATRDCGYLTFMLDEPEDGEVGYDGVNRILFRQDEWCRPATEDDDKECYSPQAAAITTLFFVDDCEDPRDGAILDADIEVNAVNFAVTEGTRSSGTGSPADLANTLTHEVGHLVGLDHTCWDMGGEPRVDDSTGALIPHCQPAGQLPDGPSSTPPCTTFRSPARQRSGRSNPTTSRGSARSTPGARRRPRAKRAVPGRAGGLRLRGRRPRPRLARLWRNAPGGPIVRRVCERSETPGRTSTD